MFEEYFDVDKAAEEHRGYIHMLERNGIRVYTVGDILNEVGIDSLRILANNVLTYDISEVPDEDADASEAYRQEVLSQMSRADLIRCILMQPTVGVLVEWIPLESLIDGYGAAHCMTQVLRREVGD